MWFSASPEKRNEYEALDEAPKVEKEKVAKLGAAGGRYAIVREKKKDRLDEGKSREASPVKRSTPVYARKTCAKTVD